MNQRNFLIVIFLTFSFAWPAAAQIDDPKRQWSMAAKSVVEITSYDAESQTYEVTHQEFPGQGPLIATPEDLAKAIPTIKLSKILRDPTSVVQNHYETDHELRLLNPKQLEARKKRLGAQPRK